MDAFKEKFLLKELIDGGYSIGFTGDIPDISLITKSWFIKNASISGKALSFENFVKLYLQAIDKADKNVYKENRVKEYPSIEDQLDMLYWDSVNGTTKWKDLIASIKSKYPKS